MIYIISSKNAAVLKRAMETGGKKAWFEIITQFSSKLELSENDQVYLDVSALSGDELKKALRSLNKCDAFWGIIDPKGASADPASFFFEGASDYIGPALIKQGLKKKRFDTALSWFAEGFTESDTGEKAGTTKKKAGKAEADNESRKSPKLPAGKFKGWKSIRTGATEEFFFLYVSLSAPITGNSSLRSLIGEDAFSITKKRLRDVLQHNLAESVALLWMETENDSLFLIPARLENARAAIESSLKIILNTRLIAIEKLGLLFQPEFTFALHYGKTIFQAPGKTGTVISQTVNYIYHLGAKKAEYGRLTISEDVGEEVIPDGLHDFFTPAGVFEGIPVYHSKRFVYE